MSLADPDLKAILVVPGDLPPAFDLASVSCRRPKDFSRQLPIPLKEIECAVDGPQIPPDQPSNVYVNILLYAASADVETAYRLVVERMLDGAVWGSEVSEGSLSNPV